MILEYILKKLAEYAIRPYSNRSPILIKLVKFLEVKGCVITKEFFNENRDSLVSACRKLRLEGKNNLPNSLEGPYAYQYMRRNIQGKSKWPEPNYRQASLFSESLGIKNMADFFLSKASEAHMSEKQNRDQGEGKRHEPLEHVKSPKCVHSGESAAEGGSKDYIGGGSIDTVSPSSVENCREPRPPYKTVDMMRAAGSPLAEHPRKNIDNPKAEQTQYSDDLIVSNAC